MSNGSTFLKSDYVNQNKNLKYNSDIEQNAIKNWIQKDTLDFQAQEEILIHFN